MQDAGPDLETEDAPAPRKAKRVRKRHFAWALLTGLGGFALVLALGFLLLIGRDLQAPNWLQNQIELRLTKQLPNLDVGLGQMTLRIERADLSPRVRFQNVLVKDDTGLPFVSLSELSIRASFRAALGGQFLPKKISLSGALVKLRRASDGSFDLTFGSALTASRQGTTLVDLIEGLDGLLVLPELAYLQELQAESLTVLYEDAREGRAWTVDGGRVRVTADDDVLSIGADFALLGGQDYATTLEFSYESAIGSPAASIGLKLADAPSQDIASQSAALSWMGALRAPISGSLRTQVDSDGQLGKLNATLQIGTGVIQPEIEAKAIPFDSAQAYFSYDPETQVLEFDELNVNSAWVKARAEGRARLQGLSGDQPEALLGQFRVSNLQANPNTLYPEPITLDQADLDMRISFEPFRFDVGQLVLSQADQTLIGSGFASIDDAGWRVAVDARSDAIKVDEVKRVWPAQVKPKTRDWVRDNILAGALSNVQLGYRASGDTAPKLFLGFDFAKAKLRYLKSLPPMEQASGFALIDGSRFLAVAEQGFVAAPKGGRIDVAGTYFEIPNLRKKGPEAIVKLSTRSTITAALSLLDQKPFEFISKVGQQVTLADGQAVASGKIGLRLKQKIPLSEISFDVTGQLSGVRSNSLIKGRVLAADQLNVKASAKEITLKGSGRVDTVPVKGIWRMPIGKGASASQFNGEIELSERFVDAFNIGLPPGTVSGKGAGQITLDLPRKATPKFALTSNLSGLGLRIDALGWRLGREARGSLTVQGALGDTSGGAATIDRLALSAPGLTANGAIELSSNGGLERARFERVQVGSWLDAGVTLIGRGKNEAPAVQIKGGRLDLRNLPEQNGTSGNGAPVPIDLALERLQVSKDIVFTRFAGKFASKGGLDGAFTGVLNGGAAIEGRAVPRNGKTSIRLASRNAGAALSAAGLLKSASGGILSLTLIPRQGVGQYDGTLAITNMRLQDAPPALAVLSAASGIGLLEQMDGRGLMFAEVNSSFRVSPQTITVVTGNAVGPSVGISVDGFYDIASKRMDMQGVVSPFFALNGIGSIFTRKGEGLVGFNYTLQGPSSGPAVKVNPLSIFTPGMFREIFRRPPPKVSQ